MISILFEIFSYKFGFEQWIKTNATLNNARYLAAAINRDNRSWWVTGGMNGNYHAYKSTELLSYDEITGSQRFSPATDLPISMLGHCITRINGSHLFLGGGNTQKAYLFDENKLSFIELPEMLKKRMGPACSVVQYDDGDNINGTVIMVVGGSSNFDDSTYTTTEIIQVDNLLKWKFGPKFDIDSGWVNMVIKRSDSQFSFI